MSHIILIFWIIDLFKTPPISIFSCFYVILIRVSLKFLKCLKYLLLLKQIYAHCFFLLHSPGRIIFLHIISNLYGCCKLYVFVLVCFNLYFSLFSLTSDILLRTWDGVDSGEEHISSVSRNSISSFELSEVYSVMLKCAEFVLVEYTKLCSTNVHLKKYC